VQLCADFWAVTNADASTTREYQTDILAPFQWVLHAAACTVMDLKPHDRVTLALRELHWLPVAERIQYKLCLLVHKSCLGHTPEYISDLLTSVPIFQVDLNCVWPPRCAADMSTNWWQSLFCCCTASMEQATDGA